jgi:hypothetical protein
MSGDYGYQDEESKLVQELQTLAGNLPALARRMNEFAQKKPPAQAQLWCSTAGSFFGTTGAILVLLAERSQK